MERSSSAVRRVRQQLQNCDMPVLSAASVVYDGKQGGQPPPALETGIVPMLTAFAQNIAEPVVSCVAIG